MKSPVRIAVLATMIACLLPAAVPGQKDSGSRVRGLFTSGRSDAVRILVLKNEGGTQVPVDPSRTFKAGDEINVAFESNFDGYVYVVNITPGGVTRVLFPYAQEGDNKVKARTRHTLPANGTFTFDQETGTETLQVIMSRKPIQVYDDAVKTAKGEVGTTAASAAAELGGGQTAQPVGIVTENVSIALPQGVPSGIRTRRVVLAAGKDNDREGSVVAIPDEKKAPGKLSDGDVAVIEIRLKHT